MQILAYSMWAQQRRAARQGGCVCERATIQPGREEGWKESEKDRDRKREELMEDHNRKKWRLTKISLVFPIFHLWVSAKNVCLEKVILRHTTQSFKASSTRTWDQAESVLSRVAKISIIRVASSFHPSKFSPFMLFSTVGACQRLKLQQTFSISNENWVSNRGRWTKSMSGSCCISENSFLHHGLIQIQFPSCTSSLLTAEQTTFANKDIIISSHFHVGHLWAPPIIFQLSQQLNVPWNTGKASCPQNP